MLLRELAQVSSVEAFMHLADGNVQQARLAVSANEHLCAALDQRPELVSLMISVAVQSLMANPAARLSERDGGDWDVVAHKTTQWRAAFRQTVPLEIWSCLNGELSSDWPNWQTKWDGILKPTPAWFQSIIKKPLLMIEISNDSLAAAEMMKSVWSDDSLKAADLGTSQEEDLYKLYPSSRNLTFERAWKRVNTALVLQEQAAAVRFARTQMFSAAPPQHLEHASLAVPGSKWEFDLDPATHTAKIRLTPIPLWISHSDVAPPSEFYLMPLDGSKPWEFSSLALR